ncbi:MAG: amino acid permease [Gammaproteobacteria bacterium]|nr:amino acid permease [Gammaproteobacteria bacterium]
MQEGKLVRVVKRRGVLTLAFGAMIGWGWVALAGGWIDTAGSAGAMLAFLGGGLTVLVVGLTYAELASAMPQVGGEHVYSLRALGRKASFLCTWAILLGYVSVVMFEAVALPTVIEYLLPNFSRGYLWTIAGWDVEATWVAAGAAAAVVMTAINVIGIRTAARVQLLATVLILIAGVVLVGSAVSSGETANLQPLFIDGYKGMLGVLVIVPLMMVGFDVIPQSAEEIDLPFEMIGKLLVVSIVMAVSWYILVIWGVATGLTGAERAAASLPTADAAGAMSGSEWASRLLILGGIAGILTSWNAFLIGGSRALYALAHAGQLPGWFGHLHPRFNTPHRAVLFIGGLSVCAPLLGRQALVWFVDAGSFGVIIAYAFVALSFLVLRYREPDMQRPYAVRYWRTVGYSAFALSCAIALLFLPFSPAALIWPWEWAIAGGWWLAGLILLLRYR